MMKTSSIPREIPELLALKFRLKRQAHALPLTAFEKKVLALVETRLARHANLDEHLRALGTDGSFMVG